jgi:hypothetical protein
VTEGDGENKFIDTGLEFRRPGPTFWEPVFSIFKSQKIIIFNKPWFG